MQSKSRSTPLQLAAQNGKTDAVERLLAHGANVHHFSAGNIDKGLNTILDNLLQICHDRYRYNEGNNFFDQELDTNLSKDLLLKEKNGYIKSSILLIDNGANVNSNTIVGHYSYYVIHQCNGC